jgi:alpha-ketoglutaric semialdehyde dehydrogenase
LTPGEPVFIEGRLQPSRAPAGYFRAVSPLSGEPFGPDFPISTADELERAVRAGARVAPELEAVRPEILAGFFDAYAGLIEKRAAELTGIAHAETGLPEEPRLKSIEIPRTTSQLRMAADAVRDRSWRRAVIDTRAGLRSMSEALGGPVLIFGPNNFPFAFNAVSGGDFAAALAAGNPVIAKAHPLHPGTSRLLLEAARTALAESGLPPAAVQMVYHFEPAVGLSLVAHPLIAAAAFTGSRAAGLRLKAAADRAGKPIYLEMSSLNPVIILPDALAERPEAIARELFESCTLGGGQFCTKPGLVLIADGPGADRFIESAAALFRDAEPAVLVGRAIVANLARSIARHRRLGAAVAARGRRPRGPGFLFPPTLLRVAGTRFLGAGRALRSELFGAATLIVLARDFAELGTVVSSLEGSLTGSIYSRSGEVDEAAYRTIEALLKPKVGRLINDRMPTGVAVSPAMNHGGPFPATGHPGFTAVGIPASLLRFAALRCYDGVRPERLPPELQDRNPNGRMWRWIDGEWTRRDL